MVELRSYKAVTAVRFCHEVPSFASVDVEKAGTRNPCEEKSVGRIGGPSKYQLLLRTSNPAGLVSRVKCWEMREVPILANSIALIV